MIGSTDCWIVGSSDCGIGRVVGCWMVCGTEGDGREGRITAISVITRMLMGRQVDMAPGGSRRRKQRQVGGDESHTSGVEVRGGRGEGRGVHGGCNRMWMWIGCGSVHLEFRCMGLSCSLHEERGVWDGGSAIEGE